MRPVVLSEKRINVVVQAVEALIKGRSNGPRGQFTVTQSAATTTVTHDNITANANIVWSASSSASAAEVASYYLGAVTKGQFVFHHPNNSTADRLIDWIASGG